MGKFAYVRSGMSGTPEYWAWGAMKDRCLNPKCRFYKNYGGRGITICDRWKNSFEEFYKDVGRRPSKTHSLDRIDNSKGYEPGNVRWATREQQISNRRTNRYLTFNGETLTCAQWARRIGISRTVLMYRIDYYKWPIERALTEPLQQGQGGVKRQRTITFNGETLTISEWAKRVGISRKALASRIDHSHWPLEKALCLAMAPGVSLDDRASLTYKGETLSYSEWAKRTGLRRVLIWERVNRYNWTAERALTTK